ncbi:MAG: hypothetical protein ACK5W9_11195 [Bdellovibrionales bacterium]
MFLFLILVLLTHCQSRKPAGVAPPTTLTKAASVLMPYEKWHASCSDLSLSSLSGFWVGPQIRELTGSLPESPQLRPFFSDGCSSSPNSLPWENKQSSWEFCCIDHDIDYWIGGTSEERKISDENLKSCIANSGSPRVAKIYHSSVSFFGTPDSLQNFRWGYGWNYKRNYGPLTEQEKDFITQVYQQPPKEIKEQLRKQAQLPLLNSCGKSDLVFKGFEKMDRILFSYINENLNNNDIIDWIRTVDFSMDKHSFEVKLRSCPEPIYLEVDHQSQVAVKSQILCENWKK